MPPFAAPVPDDEPPEPPKGRRPYSSPTAEPDVEEPGVEPGVEPRRRPRRVVNRPDKLVAGGPLPETEPEPDEEEAGTFQGTRIPPYVRVYPVEEPPETQPVPEPPEEHPADEDEPGVRRVGRPPAGRPTRPDLLV
ncbi:hypothetical protein E1295_48155, partial [Nonomuraea mesophila]